MILSEELNQLTSSYFCWQCQISYHFFSNKSELLKAPCLNITGNEYHSVLTSQSLLCKLTIVLLSVIRKTRSSLRHNLLDNLFIGIIYVW